jgi:hypothetical protein
MVDRSMTAEEIGMVESSDQDVIIKRKGGYQVIATAAPEIHWSFRIFGFFLFGWNSKETMHFFPLKTWEAQTQLARRMAACWNACLGISTKELESISFTSVSAGRIVAEKKS